MASPVVNNFMKQQGFPEEPADACNMRFEGLYFQPRIVFPLVLLATVLQSVPLFLALSAVLWWNVEVPRLNPFELAYNRWIAGPRGRLLLTPAPAPRRFSSRSCSTRVLRSATRAISAPARSPFMSTNTRMTTSSTAIKNRPDLTGPGPARAKLLQTR